MRGLLAKAEEFIGSELIDSQIKSLSGNTLNLALCKGSVTLQSRSVMALAAKTKQNPWYKTVSRAEEVGRYVVAPYLNQSEPGFLAIINDIWRWLQSGIEIDLLAIDRGIVTAPARCGKTHLITEALIRHSSAKPILVLTHTNAGVAALRTKLDRTNVPASRYRLYTIDVWAMRLVKTFPKRSGIDPTALLLHNRKRDYPLIRDAAWRAVAMLMMC